MILDAQNRNKVVIEFANLHELAKHIEQCTRVLQNYAARLPQGSASEACVLLLGDKQIPSALRVRMELP